MVTLSDPSAQPPQDPKSVFRRPILFSAILALCVVVYVGFVMFTRYESNQTIAKRNAVKAAEERRANDLAAVQQLGGSQLAIRSLYVSPQLIHPGEKAQLCFDVDNAKTVTLDPPAGEVWPSHTRCLDLSPTKTTTYTLTITGANGQSTSQSVKLEVKEQAPIHIDKFPSR
jgi:hypothetical protein